MQLSAESLWALCLVWGCEMTMIDIIRKLVKPQECNAKELLVMAGMAERNEARIAKIKAEMGDKYILHPNHKSHKLDTPRPV